MAHALQGAIQSAGKPALILVGRHQEPPSDPGKVIIAWDEVPQAARAVHHSLPLLKRAQEVEILTISEKNDKENGLKRATSLKTWLLRHGINAAARTESREGQFVSHVLVDQVNRSRANLLVMGAYSHTRASERLFAGATHAALTELETPLLLSH
ncbi:MAG: universal stress protein [Granulosicoccus sp.]